MQPSAEIIANDTDSRYIIKRMSRDKLGDLAKLYAEVHHIVQPEEYFIKKYDTRYTGVEYAGYIVYHHNKTAIAYYGVIPCFIVWHNEKILAAQSADTMTHPQHRYKGMFVELSLRTFELCRELGIRLVFGFPNQNSYHGAVTKLGWKMTETMDCFSIPVKSFPLAALAGKSTILSKLYKKYCRLVLEKEETTLRGIESSVLADGYAGVGRTEGYLQHKTYHHTIVIREGKAVVWIRIKHSLLIGDMADVNEANFKTVMQRLKKIARKLGLKSILFHSSPGTHLHRLFANSFEAKPSFPSLFQDFGSPVSPEKIKFVQADLDIF